MYPRLKGARWFPRFGATCCTDGERCLCEMTGVVSQSFFRPRRLLRLLGRTYASAVKDVCQCLRIEDLSTRGAHGKCVCVVPSSNRCPRWEAGWGPARFLPPASVLAREVRAPAICRRIRPFRLGWFRNWATWVSAGLGLLRAITLGCGFGLSLAISPPFGDLQIPATMASDVLPDIHQRPPGLKMIPTHPNISPFAAGIRQVEEDAAANFIITSSGEQNSATSSQIGLQNLPQTLSGVTTIIKEPSVARIDADLKKPQFSDIRVFAKEKTQIRGALGEIGKIQLDIHDPQFKTKKMALVPPDFERVEFPATLTAGAPPATAVLTAGKNSASPVQHPDSKKFTPSLSQVVSASDRVKVPTSITEPLPDREVTVHRGMPAVRFMQSEVSQLALIDKYILVGKFSHGQPKLEVIKQHFSTNYVFRGTVSVGWRDSKHVFIMFSNSHDCTNILLEGTLIFNGLHPMRLFRWTPDFDPEFETSLSPVWISFYGLPLHMFNFHALSLICKPIGKLLGVDSVTLAKAKPHVARVCVEMDLLAPRPKDIFVGVSEVFGEEDCGFVQPVVYEKVPYYCDYCWRQGHSLERCKLYKPETQQPKPKSKTHSAPPTQTPNPSLKPIPSNPTPTAKPNLKPNPFQNPHPKCLYPSPSPIFIFLKPNSQISKPIP
ncbi:hypothetical protein DM860_018265 [Cuscuta australis]|uniref:DUF4283 domain-containing protein n=1 Tax=Cuscuta australis TaxID=267555 RepID=A0A328E148_9ASTE|nr:hypothetical protein DM860_018265 [Cuscuta australis]